MENEIIEKINNNPGYYVMFYSPGCKYCDDSLKLLRDSNVNYKGYNIDKIPGEKAYVMDVFLRNKESLQYKPEFKTKPFIFLNGKFIGGFNELKNLIKP